MLGLGKDERNNKKMQLLKEKLNLLIMKQSSLSRSGKLDEANAVLEEINRTLFAINKLSQNQYDRATAKFDISFNKANRNLNNMRNQLDKEIAKTNFFTQNNKIDNEVERYLTQITQNNGRSR